MISYCLPVLFKLQSTVCQWYCFSPYDTSKILSNEKDLNNKNISKILSDNSFKDSLYIAIISDSHIEYSILNKIIFDINKDENINFVIHLGDMTDGGLYKEYSWTNRIMEKLHKPYIMLIGNHEYL